MPGLLRILPHFYTSTDTKVIPVFVKVVSFDATDTVITMDEPFNIVYSRVASDRGVPVDSSLVATSFLKYMKNLSVSHPCFGFGSIGHVEWWKRLVVGCLEEVLFIAQYLFHFYSSGTAWRIVDPEVSTLETFINTLRRKEVGVVIVSNFDGRLRKILQDMNLYSLFDLIVASGEVGVEKPSPSIFEKVTNHYRLSNASELLHIGDSVQNDYLAARNSGANAILFDRSSLNNDVSELDKISSFSQLQIL
uniref:HAD family hydrolase n=1 Tax=Angiostrongylus cantonensis TaxID=6313 RepID=A0A0K0DRV1_ANGCA